MAGHSAWKNIKHRKARADALRGKAWSKCARAIIVAARQGGGDLDSNYTLRYAVEEAKWANMPRATIENAIKKGVGGGTGDDYEPVMYEGYGPGGVALLVEALTNNRNRTAGDVRLAFDKAGGKLGAVGSVGYMFEAKGVIAVPRGAIGEEKLMEIALEAGAEDVAGEGDSWSVTTGPAEYRAVQEALTKAGIEGVEGQLTRVPTTMVEAAGEVAKKVLDLIETLDENDDVQKVHANLEISEADLAKLDK